MRITVFHADECDRKKCTSIKMERLGKCKLVYNINKIPSGAIVLNPYACVHQSIDPDMFPALCGEGINFERGVCHDMLSGGFANSFVMIPRSAS